MSYKVSDKVTAFGLLGFVLNVRVPGIVNGQSVDDSIEVAFIEANFCQRFTADGKADPRHKESILKHIVPPKKIVAKRLYIAVILAPEAASSRGGHYCSLAYPERIHAEGQFSSLNQVCEVVVNVEE